MLTGLSAATGAREVARSVGLRLALAAASGIFVGGYIALEFFPGQGPLQVAIRHCFDSITQHGVATRIEQTCCALLCLRVLGIMYWVMPCNRLQIW